MSKAKKNKEEKPLTKEEVAKFKPNDPLDQLNTVMGFGLLNAHQLAIEEGATVVKKTSPEIKAGNVDALPEAPKKKNDHGK